MTARQQLQDEYASALVEHMANGGEAALNQAYELGRRILSEGYGVLDQVMLHNEGLGRIIASGPEPDVRRGLDRAAEFLAESLSPFEMLLRGYREANSRLTALQETLEQKIEERTRELVKASKVKDDFLAMVSHELRTPLTTINAVLGLIDAEALGAVAPQLRRPVGLARRNCERLMRVVNDLLDLTRIDRGAFDLNVQIVELEPVLLQAIEGRRINPGTRTISFAVAASAKGIMVEADPPRLQQVLDNLLTNADKFSQPNLPIEVGVERRGEYVRVAVSDHGIGIAEEFCDHVFKPFSQADSSATRARGGVGLGLSIAKAIVEAHRGRIGFASAEGEGTTFYFDLPIACAL